MTTLELIRTTLGWCTLINMGLLMWWSFFMMFKGDWVHKMHNRFLEIERARFNEIHYGGIALFKIAIFMFNLVPWIALHIVA